MNQKQTVGLVGALLIAIGVFTPLVTIPIMGSLNAFQNGEGDGIILLGLEIPILLLILAKKFKYICLPAFAIAGILVYDFINIQNKLHQLSSQSSGLAAGMIGSIQMQWGWAILALGVLCLFTCSLSGFLKVEDKPSESHSS